MCGEELEGECDKRRRLDGDEGEWVVEDCYCYCYWSDRGLNAGLNAGLSDHTLH